MSANNNYTIKNMPSDKDAEACTHDRYTVVDCNPGADGLGDVKIHEIRCKDCGQKLACQTTCISALEETVYDKAWGARHGYYDRQE